MFSSLTLCLALLSISVFLTVQSISHSSRLQHHTTFLARKTSSNPRTHFTKNPLFKRVSTAPNSIFSIRSLKSNVSEPFNSPISGNSTILSPNGVFELGFFSPNGGSSWYLGIWYASIPIKTYVWVANRETPISNNPSANLSSRNGRLEISDSIHQTLWQTDNTERGTQAKLLNSGNLVLLSPQGKIVWQSFDYPTDSWLPGMNITRFQRIICWRSNADPSPGNYHLQFGEPDYGEFILVFNNTETYWSTGKWAGNAFTNVPEMTVPYIYNFVFQNPFTESATFMYTENSRENGIVSPLTRFSVDVHGQLKQYTWSSQSEHWNMFWSQPDNPCRVYGLCGNFGFCSYNTLRPCECLIGFCPVDYVAWNMGDFSDGCHRDSESVCEESDKFNEIGVVSFDVDRVSRVTSYGSRSLCEESCLKNCSCFGLNYDEKSGLCKNLFGSVVNLRNLTSDNTEEDILFIRIGNIGNGSKKQQPKKVGLYLIVGISGLVLVMAFVTGVLFMVLQKRRKRKDQDIMFPVTNLKVFSYKELHTATRGFLEKLGHGGFGAVFRGELTDSLQVAVKRLERPGGSGGEKEFRAEVCTIGNVQHVNLVRLRGFCCENAHRLLVYDYMQNGPLSNFLGKDGGCLSWDVRFRVALGTARGIAYLHEECRDCIMHCDIKPENILLDSEFMAKVSDFGMAKLIGREFSRVLTTMRGTLGYVAPEWISGVAITPKADVYSYGMTLFEIIGGRRNVETPTSAGKGKDKTDKWFFPPWAARQIIEDKVELVVDNRLVGAYDRVEAKRVGLVAVWCIQDDESVRPTMGTVVKMLEGTVEVALPPPPQLLQALVSGDSFCGIRAVTSEDQDSFTTCSHNSNDACAKKRALTSEDQDPSTTCFHNSNVAWSKKNSNDACAKKNGNDLSGVSSSSTT